VSESEFVSLIVRFAESPFPAVSRRHVYLWHGDLGRLLAAIPAVARRRLDLHALAGTLPRAPYALDEARQLLRRAVQQQLDELREPGRQQILVVTGTDLLSRYRVPLAPFLAAASEHLLVILVVSASETAFESSLSLPDYVSLNTGAPLEYLLGALDQPSAVVRAE